MSRTTTILVEALLGNDYDPAPEVGEPTDLQQYIDSAGVIVSRVATCAAAKGMALTTEELELIERWLSAHCYVQMDQTYASHSDGASASFHGQTGMHLESSRYGQMAMDIDYSGCLTAISKRQIARAAWLGKPPSEQTDYDQRS